MYYVSNKISNIYMVKYNNNINRYSLFILLGYDVGGLGIKHWLKNMFLAISAPGLSIFSFKN